MNCDEAKDFMTVGVFGRLSPEQRKRLLEHVRDCPECRLRFERMTALMDRLSDSNDIPLPDPERSWAVIADRVLPGRSSRAVSPMRRWAPAAAALLAVFVLGYFAGRRFLAPSPSSSDQLHTPAEDRSFSTYADSLRPVLIDFLNRDGRESPENIQRLKSGIIRDMLNRTRLLRGIAARGEDPALQDLLMDLEFFLTALDNLRPEDRETARHLAGLIRDREIPLRLRELIVTRPTL